MKMSILDRSNYFKGLLLLVAKDAVVTEPEKKLMTSIGHTLGFESKFCNEAIRDILSNKHISPEPPKFSNDSIARTFLKDGFRLILSDPGIDERELVWLKSVAEMNNIPIEWFEQEWNQTEKSHDNFSYDSNLELEKFI
ncbi:MAG: hypothetical protein K9J16_10105 [Melioribacteraceae bacterium]|nr:hypothetical protein [Melioribacteraceae bacterium]MCF8354288.1 hypothetical protein [Melioribacteraceae bacterium]MCF8394580.1 hypothetical protein [Melioribacteraceae bacterium]MCF8419751.1 hypothetical protein [Melioribacteraceae bacterium]